MTSNQLESLLRVELTAVHQQFIHMLSLRQWNDKMLLSRITEVDSVDFKNAMQIIELLVSRHQPIHLRSQSIRPGSDIASILQSELRMEEDFAKVLGQITTTDPEEMKRVDKASAPRNAYRQWLHKQLKNTDVPGASKDAEESLADLLAQLIALIEQPMLHAFLMTRAGDHHAADNAWRLSGAAMLYATALVKRGALNGHVPTPATVPPVKMSNTPALAFSADLELAGKCSSLARLAAQDVSDDAAGRICIRIADDCDLISKMQIKDDFPAKFGRSKVFESFSGTCAKHLV